MVFHTKIAGVTFSNEGENTQNRQRIIAELCQKGGLDEDTELILRRDPHNPHDQNAVAVLAPDGRQLGFLPAETAKNVAPHMDHGVIYRAFVTSVTGGDADSWYGVNLRIVYDTEQQDTQSKDIADSQNENVPAQGVGSRLLICPDCGGKVSRRAEVCPHCGCPVQVILGDVLRSMKQRAETGDVESQLQLAAAYHSGDESLSIRQDDEASKAWLLRAAAAGSRAAYEYLQEWYASPEEDFIVEDKDLYDHDGIYDGTLTKITKYTGSGGIVVIPERIINCYCDSFAIADGAFKGCVSVTGVVLCDRITSFGPKAFSVSPKAFEGCSNLTGIVLSQGMTRIDEYTFQNCTNLKYIFIPNGIKSIGDSSFRNCERLQSILIPESVELIAANAFLGCKNLKDFRIDPQNCIFEVVDGAIMKIEEGDYTLNAWIGAPKDYLFPKGTTKIGEGVFLGLTDLTSVVIPNHVTKIGWGAFYECAGLTSVVIPDGVREIGECAFNGCTGLTSIVIPDSVTEIKWGTFSGCTGLTSIVISNSVKQIRNYAFKGCTGLTSIIIPDSGTKIGKDAFAGCPKLVIYARKNSAAAAFAERRNIPFKALED